MTDTKKEQCSIPCVSSRFLNEPITHNDKLYRMARTLTEILKDADKATDLQALIGLWNEIANNKYKYPLVQIWYANEHIRELALKVDGADIDKGHFWHTLNEMHEC